MELTKTRCNRAWQPPPEVFSVARGGQSRTVCLLQQSSEAAIKLKRQIRRKQRVPRQVVERLTEPQLAQLAVVFPCAFIAALMAFAPQKPPTPLVLVGGQKVAPFFA